jgi:hypothetical protein
MLALHPRPLLLLRNPRRPSDRAPPRRPLPSPRALEFGQMGDAGECCGTGLGGLLRDFLAFPAVFAGHGRDDELCRPDHGRGDLSCVGRLVYFWEEEVCAAA